VINLKIRGFDVFDFKRPLYSEYLPGPGRELVNEATHLRPPFLHSSALPPQVKQALADLEDKWAVQSDGHHTDASGTTP